MKTGRSDVILKASVSYLSTIIMVDVPAGPRRRLPADDKCRWLCNKDEGNCWYHLRLEKTDLIVT